MCQEQGVRGYPALKYYKPGSIVPQAYSGGRSMEALKSFVDNTLLV